MLSEGIHAVQTLRAWDNQDTGNTLTSGSASAPASSQNLSHGTSELIVHGAHGNSPHTSDPPALLLLFGIPREERKGPPSPSTPHPALFCLALLWALLTETLEEE